MHFNDSNSIALHLKTNSIPKSKYRKILVENTIIIALEIDKLQLQKTRSPTYKNKKNLKSVEFILKIATMFRKA